MTYTFAEVVKGLKEGKRYSRKISKWGGTMLYIHPTEKNLQIYFIADSDDWHPEIDDFEAMDWIEVKDE